MPFESRSLYLRRENQRPKIVSFQRIFLVFITIIVICFFFIKSTGSYLVKPGKYSIEKGYTVSQLSEKFHLGISSWRYALWLRLFAPRDVTLQFGTYQLDNSVTLEDFLTKTLKKPLYTDQTITILPGWSSYDIDAYLADKRIGSVGDFRESIQINFSQYQKDFSFLSGVKNLEGFLYPDTYRIRQDATMDDIVRVMLREFEKKIGSSYGALETKKAYQTLILASIVEREERNDTNQPIVAGILEKRVREGIAMGADATVCIGYGKTQKQCTTSFIASVIRDKNPYNTRNTTGYPPTPIANIPLSSWNAALRPTSSSYYYYLHGSDGQIHYGKTNEEHIANKQKYLP